MKGLFSVTSFLYFSITTVFAQNVKISSTEEYTNELPNVYWTSVLGQDNSGYYLLREYGSVSDPSIVLEKYSPSLKLLFSSDIEATSGTINDSKLHRLTEMSNGKIYIFLEGWNKEQQQNSFLVKEVNEDGTLNKNEILLETEPSSGQMKSANYSVRFSPDGSKLLVLTQKPFEKGGKEKIRLQVFNTSDFSSIWKKDLTLENESVRYPRNEIIVDNNGVAYLFKDDKLSLKEHIYSLQTISENQSKIELINLKNYNVGQKKLMINHSGNLLICGTLVPPGGADTDWQGIWYFQANSSGAVLQNKVEPIGRNVLSLLTSQKNAEKEGYVLQNFVLKDILLESNGDVLFLTEEQSESKSIVGESTPPKYEYSLLYGNALVISFDDAGNTNWATTIDKKQEEKTMDPKKTFGSFAYQLKNDKLYVTWNYMNIFSDPPLNKFRYWIDLNGSKINIDNIFGKEAHYPTLLTVIDENGNFQHRDRTFSSLPLEDIQKPNAFRMAIDPNIFFATDNGIIILSRMPGVETKRYKFNTINY